MVIGLNWEGKKDGSKTGLKTIIQTRVEENTKCGSGMDGETRAWMPETSYNLKLLDLAIDCAQKEGEREREKKKLALIFEFKCISQKH